MNKLNFKPFIKEDLIEKLKANFPEHKIQTGFGGLQVRTSGFTATGNVKLNISPKKGTITTQTNYDMVVLFIIICWPLGLYVYSKKQKQKDFENLVVEKLNEILEPAELNVVA